MFRYLNTMITHLWFLVWPKDPAKAMFAQTHAYSLVVHYSLILAAAKLYSSLESPKILSLKVKAKRNFWCVLYLTDKESIKKFHWNQCLNSLSPLSRWICTHSQSCWESQILSWCPLTFMEIGQVALAGDFARVVDQKTQMKGQLCEAYS